MLLRYILLMTNKYVSVAIGAVAVTAAAPVVISVTSLVLSIWPIMPLVLVSSLWLSREKGKATHNDIRPSNSRT